MTSNEEGWPPSKIGLGRGGAFEQEKELDYVSNVLAMECAARPSVPLGLSVNFQAKEQEPRQSLGPLLALIRYESVHF